MAPARSLWRAVPMAVCPRLVAGACSECHSVVHRREGVRVDRVVHSCGLPVVRPYPHFRNRAAAKRLRSGSEQASRGLRTLELLEGSPPRLHPSAEPHHPYVRLPSRCETCGSRARVSHLLRSPPFREQVELA